MSTVPSITSLRRAMTGSWKPMLGAAAGRVARRTRCRRAARPCRLTIDEAESAAGLAAHLAPIGRSGRTGAASRRPRRCRDRGRAPRPTRRSTTTSIGAVGLNLQRVVDQVLRSRARAPCGRPSTTRPSSARTHDRPRDRSADGPGRRRRSATAPSAHRRWHRSSSRRSVASSTSSFTSSVSSRVSLSRSASSRSREPGDSSSYRCITVTLVRRLVSGVRSSWPASCTSWCCARFDRASDGEHAVERLARAGRSRRVPSTGTSTSRSPESATSLAASVRRTSRRVTCAR